MGAVTRKGSLVVRNKRNPRAQKRQAGHAGQSHLAHQSGASAPRGITGPSGLPLLRTSERGTFKRCRFKWWLEFHEIVKPKVDVPPLRFGGLLHEALAVYYRPGVRRGPRPHLTFEQLYERDLIDAAGSVKSYSKPEIDERWAEHRDLGYDMLQRYWERYHPDDQYKVLVTEFPFQTIIQHPIRGTPWFWYVGILDGVWLDRESGRKVIPDHKSTASIQLNYLRMDPQSTAYWTFGVDSLIAHGLLAPDGSEHIDGILFNFLRKAKTDERPRDAEGQYHNSPKKEHYIRELRKSHGFDPKWKLAEMEAYAERRQIVVLGDVSLKQPTPYHARVPVYRAWHEREEAKLAILAEFKDMEGVHASAGVRGTPSAYKNASQFTCNGCWAIDICELHEIGQDWIEMREMTTAPWEPYAPHEIREGR